MADSDNPHLTPGSEDAPEPVEGSAGQVGPPPGEAPQIPPAPADTAGAGPAAGAAPDPTQPDQAAAEVPPSEAPTAVPAGAAPPDSSGLEDAASGSSVTAAAGADGSPGRLGRLKHLPPRRNLAWAAVALLLVLGGVVASVLGARSVARGNAGETRAQFRAASTGVTSTLKLAIAHEEDVLTSVGTYFAAHPHASQREFQAWLGWARIVRRHPEAQRLTLVGIVPAAGLVAFADRRAGRPVPAAATRTPASARASAATALRGSVATKPLAPPFPIRPSGSRPFYCLAVAELARGPVRTRPPGLDYCASGHTLLAARDSGVSAYAASSVAGTPALQATEPIYAGNPTPRTPAARVGSSVGWVRELLLPGVIVQQALRGRPGDAIRLRHGSTGATTTYVSGTPEAGGQSYSVSLRNGWSARIFGPAPKAAVFGDRYSRWVLIGGCLLSLLAGMLVYLLGTRRGRIALPRRRGPSGEDLYDDLTGLPTRVLTMDRAGRMVARAGRQSGMLTGALLIDVDWFKDVNEKLGHDAGDQLLRIVAERLEQVVRDQDTVGRLDGDEFVIVVESAARGARLDALARRVIEALHKRVELEGFGPSVFLTASIGLAFGRYTDPEALLRDAGLALQSAKTAGKDRYTLFNANMRAVIEDRGVLEAELNTALQERQFFLLYQPIYDLGSHRVVAVEALIRWRHPKRGILLPDDFIPLAEEAGLAVPIGRWVLEEACARTAAWNVTGHRVGVSVMVTSSQLNREGFATDVLRALQQSGVEPSLLTLEVAEATVMADVSATGERLELIKRLGVSIAIDDFGSGYAYRSDLQRMPLDYLKVDRRSLAATEDEDYRSWLLEAILVFARDLSLTVIAKGVETAEQLANLRGMGCAMAQGFFVGEPVAAEAVVGLLESHLPATGASTPS